jgi:hypothetical protein
LAKYGHDVHVSATVWNFSILHPMPCIPKAMVGWKRRMSEVLTEREVLEHLRIEIHVHNTIRWGNNSLVYQMKISCYRTVDV